MGVEHSLHVEPAHEVPGASSAARIPERRVRAHGPRSAGGASLTTGASDDGRMPWHLDDYTLDAFVAVAAHFHPDHYAYVVTPNVDHLIRLHEDVAFRGLYANAGFVLLDSRFLAHLLRLVRGVTLPVCAGSDLVARLFADVIRPDDPLVMIGGSAEQVRVLSARYGLRGLVHHDPPMGFIDDPEAVEACLRFIETHSPFRFCLLAIGSPQQEIIARRLQERGRACGLALCIGAAVQFLTGIQKRAPLWMQRSGLEWAYRLTQEPARMAHRYLVRGPRVFSLLSRTDVVLRPARVSPSGTSIADIDAPHPRAAGQRLDRRRAHIGQPGGS